MKIVFGLLVIFGCVSTSFAQNCANGNCANGMSPVGPRPNQGFNPPPIPNTTKNPVGYPAPIAGLNGKDGLPGKDGKDRKDIDPAILNNLTKALDNLNAQLQANQENYKKIDERLVSLEKTVNGLSSASSSSVEKIQKEIDTLNQKLAGSLRVRFKYDPKSDSLTPLY